MKRLGIVVTIGDPAGIGPEVVVKAYQSMKDRFHGAVFFLIGDKTVLSRYGWRGRPNVVLVDPGTLVGKAWRPGHPSRATGQASFSYLKTAAIFLRQGLAQGIVTAPISKENIQKAGFSWPGHTEFLAHVAGVKNVEMVFVGERLKVALVTRHVSLAEAIRSVRPERIIACGRIVESMMRQSFGISRPRIAVCGLNPHAGEKGLFGKEEARYILPAIRVLNRSGRARFIGPLPADTVFCQALEGSFDLVVAMYHDQGLAPFKAVSFASGVNVSAGLPFARTSPVHGTAFDIAGKDMADPSSMAAAIRLAVKITENTFR